MKKTVNINLGGFAFIVDEDAYTALQSYIDDIASRLSGDYAETLTDIEARLAEIFNQSLNQRKQVVDIEMVRSSIKTMGTADEFGEPAKKSTGSENSSKKSPEAPKLYRDTSDKILGGVCSGLAQYLNADLTLVRLITFFLILFGGLSLFIYIIMWIIVPRKPLNI